MTLVGIARKLENGEITQNDSLRSKIEQLTSDETFLALCRVGTTDPDNLKSRIERVKQIMDTL